MGKLQNLIIKRSSKYTNQWAKGIETIAFRVLTLCTYVRFFLPASLIRKMIITSLFGGMDICLLWVLCVVRKRVFVGPIPRPEESYCVCLCVCVCGMCVKECDQL